MSLFIFFFVFVLLIKLGGVVVLVEWCVSFDEFVFGLGFDVCVWDDFEVDLVCVQFVLVWQFELGWLVQFFNLKVIISVVVGVDYIFVDFYLLELFIVCMVMFEMQQCMVEFMFMSSLMLLKDMLCIIVQQVCVEWCEFVMFCMVCEICVGVFGLGVFGLLVVCMYVVVGFEIVGWVCLLCNEKGLVCFVGFDMLLDFLVCIDILICFLFEIIDICYFIDVDFLCQLLCGVVVINVGCGSYVCLFDLLVVFDSGYVFGVVLDVFDEELLFVEVVVWCYLCVLVMFYVVVMFLCCECVRQVVVVIVVMLGGLLLLYFYDCSKGY